MITTKFKKFPNNSFELVWEEDSDNYVIFAETKEAINDHGQTPNEDIRQGKRFFYWMPYPNDLMNSDLVRFCKSVL